MVLTRSHYAKRAKQTQINHHPPLRTPPGTPQLPSPPPPLMVIRTLQAILSAIQGPKGLEPQNFIRLYRVLDNLSLDIKLSCSNSGTNLTYVGTELGENNSAVVLDCICNLSDIIFEELCLRFKQLCTASSGKASPHPHMRAVSNKLKLILRCCLVILKFHENDSNLLLRKGRILQAILDILCYSGLIVDSEEDTFNFKTSVCFERTSNDDDSTTSSEEFVVFLSFLEHSSPCLPFLFAMLEVFLDELLRRRYLRKCLLWINSQPRANETLFVCHLSDDNIGILLEVITAHFLSSFSSGQACEKFLNELFCLHSGNSRVSELNIDVAMRLLHIPALLSTSKILHAYVVALFSVPIVIDLITGNTRPDMRLMEECLSTFEMSVNLYNRHMSVKQIDGCQLDNKYGSNDNSCKFDCTQSSFRFHIQSVIRKRINSIVARLDSSWHSFSQGMLFQNKNDLLGASIEFLNVNQCILDKRCKDDISHILQWIVTRALGDDDNDTSLREMGITGVEDVLFLASILKFMGCSMLQAVRWVRHCENMGYLRSLKDLTLCKEYNFLVNIIGSLQQFNVQLPIQRFLDDALDCLPAKHRGSKLMLVHFSGMLSLSFHSGFEFLVKGCLFVMMALMNFFAIEEGTLDALRTSLLSNPGSYSSGFWTKNVLEAMEDKKYGEIIASRFIKTQMQFPRMNSHAITSAINEGVAVKETTEETCTGEIYLKCLQEVGGKFEKADFDDLADFIECKPGKDYSKWLKDRQSYRDWKCEKTAVVKWKKMKRTWKITKRKKI